MAHSNTQFDSPQIQGVARQHTDMAQDIARQLEALHGEVQATMAGASSNMTRELEQVYSSWKNSVRKAVLDNLGLMAEAMITEANNQEMADSDNTRAITSTASPVGSFLGA